MRKNKEPSKYKTGARKGRVINGYHQIGDVSVDSGQIAIADPCNMGEEPDTIVSTNFGDGLFPIYEHWENNERLALVIPLSTEIHNELQDHLKNMITEPKVKEAHKSE
jgi:hypothetical protein|tara:strand:+ start:343 stop:666 length:324 start_codon:yes stop_codon:yes gene_type:complete